MRLWRVLSQRSTGPCSPCTLSASEGDDYDGIRHEATSGRMLEACREAAVELVAE
jgi:hypothetical protein